MLRSSRRRSAKKHAVARGRLEAADAAARRGGTRAGQHRARDQDCRCGVARRSGHPGAARSTTGADQPALYDDGTTRDARRCSQQTGLARHELINLGRQAQDVGVSLASGQSPFTVLVQQGSQIADVFATSSGTLRGFFSQAIGWAGRFLTSTAGIATSVAAIGVGARRRRLKLCVRRSARSRRACPASGAASGVTRDQINQIAEASSSWRSGCRSRRRARRRRRLPRPEKSMRHNVGQATKADRRLCAGRRRCCRDDQDARCGAARSRQGRA